MPGKPTQGLDTGVVGLRTRPWSGPLDARWLMSYAAGLGHGEDVYLDTARPAGVAAHPVFPIAPEWALLTDPDSALDVGLTVGEALRGVHASHDLHVHRPIHQDLAITVRAEVVGAQRTPAGALMTLRFDAVQADGAEVWTSWMGVVYRGVGVDGQDRPPADVPPAPRAAREADTTARIHHVAITAAAPHVYGECARIWNPIHTDRAVAVAAGLDGTILHGSATLAHAVDSALDALGCGPDRVRRVGSAFRAPVPVPSTITVVVTATGSLDDGDRLARFEVMNEAGAVALSSGFLVAAP
jgi:acyl dehydratase